MRLTTEVRKMIRILESSTSLVLFILLVLFAGPAFGELGSEFHFEAKFQRDPGMPDEITIKRGRWLQPMNPDKPGTLFQPVILCEDLVLRFQEDDRSELTSLWGFCPAPHLHEARKGAVWKITDIVTVEVREKGCTSEVRSQVRGANRKVPPTHRPMAETRRYPCPERGYGNSKDGCRNFFEENEQVRQDYQRDFDELERDNTCEVAFLTEDGVRRFVAVCWPKVVR